MDATDAEFDYHGAAVVVETDDDEIVFIHPLGAPHDAPGYSRVIRATPAKSPSTPRSASFARRRDSR
jgi:hypothetical protein